MTSDAVRRTAGLVGAFAVAIALWWRKNPSACPYSQRFWVQAPHPFITRERLLATTRPEPGECLLEIGPGTGYYSVDVARALSPNGMLHIIDLQPDMVDHTMRVVEKAGLDNVIPRKGDARELPYDDASFDAVFLVTVLGEIAERHRALKEIYRVMKPNGRLVVGEIFGDPHMVTLARLRNELRDAGFTFETRSGPRFGFFARFRPTV